MSDKIAMLVHDLNWMAQNLPEGQARMVREAASILQALEWYEDHDPQAVEAIRSRAATASHQP